MTFDLEEEQKENTEFRLQRKDTPHFTKGKRIVQSDEEKAREILANLEVKDGSEDDESDSENKAVMMFPFEMFFCFEFSINLIFLVRQLRIFHSEYCHSVFCNFIVNSNFLSRLTFID